MISLDEALIDELGGFALDPFGFVMWAFPWGEPGELANKTGPEPWQEAFLKELGVRLRAGHNATLAPILMGAYSGHGIGKSALVSWLLWWSFSTFPGTRGIVTANTETQLKTKTWVEITKWHRLFLAKHLFNVTATAVFSTDEDVLKEWRIDIVPWSERNTEAFAGLHNQAKRLVVIYDEASAIPDIIWEVTEGALTDKDTEILWFAFGNPTKNEGRFFESFPGEKFSHRWKLFNVDSREVSFTDKDQIQRWIDDYGEDSDFVRVRVRGLPPKHSSESFISYEVARSAIGRAIEPQEHMPLILGVDVARFGTNFSVLAFRQGRECRAPYPRAFLNISTTELAHHVASAYEAYNVDAIMIDGTGVGGGVVDALSALNLPVYDIQFGARAPGFSVERYANWRGEMWGLMREALPTLTLLDTFPGYDGSLIKELAGPKYTVNASGVIMLEPKDQMLRRGLISPDYADALALTFAYPVMKRASSFQRKEPPYNPYSMERLYANSKN